MIFFDKNNDIDDNSEEEEKVLTDKSDDINVRFYVTYYLECEIPIKNNDHWEIIIIENDWIIICKLWLLI